MPHALETGHESGLTQSEDTHCTAIVACSRHARGDHRAGHRGRGRDPVTCLLTRRPEVARCPAHPSAVPRTHLNPSEPSRALSTRQNLPIVLVPLPVKASLARFHKCPYQYVTAFRHTPGKAYPSPEWNGRAASCSRSRTVSCASGGRDRSTGEVVADVSMRKRQ